MSPNAETVTLSMYYAYKARAAEGVFLDKAILRPGFPRLAPRVKRACALRGGSLKYHRYRAAFFVIY